MLNYLMNTLGTKCSNENWSQERTEEWRALGKMELEQLCTEPPRGGLDGCKHLLPQLEGPHLTLPAMLNLGTDE